MKEIGPRHDSKPLCPPDCGDISFAEQDARFDDALEEQAEDIWLAIHEGLDEKQYSEIVSLLFRRNGGAGQADFTEAGRLLHKWLHKTVQRIVEDGQ